MRRREAFNPDTLPQIVCSWLRSQSESSRERLEVIADSSRTITVLIRTESDLSRWILSLSEFEYPAALFWKTGHILYTLNDLFEKYWLVYPDSEIVRASQEIVNARDAGYWGMKWTGTHTRATVKVPPVEYDNYLYGRDISFVSRKWTEEMARGCQATTPPTLHPGGFFFRIAYLPDRPVEELSEQQLVHLAKVNIGWNPCKRMSDDKIEGFARKLRELGKSSTPRMVVNP